MYDRSVPYSVCVRRATLTPARLGKPKLAVSVRVSLPPIASLALPPAPSGVSLLSLFQDVWTRVREPIFKHVSVPGTYQRPAPYRLQTFTYSTGLAFTGRSAACAPATATRPAAEPRRRLFTIFILNLQLTCPWEGSVRVRLHPGRSPLIPVTTRSLPAFDGRFAVAYKQETQRGDPGMPPSVAVKQITERT